MEQHRITIGLGSGKDGAALRKRITRAAKSKGQTESGYIRTAIIQSLASDAGASDAK